MFIVCLLSVFGLISHCSGHAHGGEAAAYRHDCIHDEVSKRAGYGETAPVLHVPYASHTFQGQAVSDTASFKSMRVKFFFDQGDCTGGSSTCGHCTATGQTVTTFESSTSTTTCRDVDVLTDSKKKYIMEVLMPHAQSFYSTAFRVVPVDGNLVVGGATCGSTPGTPVPSAHRSTGVADADFVIYVTAAPKSDSNSLTVAWASACYYDQNYRPLVAQVNFVPAALKNADSRNNVTEAGDKDTALHELAHALGFSNPFFRRGSGNYKYLDADGATLVTGGTATSTSAELGKSVTYINSPRVKTEVQTYFGCDTAAGGEIEDQGGAGTANSHWEKRVFSEETMAGISSTVYSFYSRITLAYFEDTGHYKVDYTVARSEMSWGKGKGCTFLQKKCNTDVTANNEFCLETNTKQELCTADYRARGYCDVSTYSSAVPTNMQYFDNANLGSGVYHTDFCPTVLPYSNLICVDSSIKDSQDIYGSTYGATSRCFVSNLIASNYKASTMATRCFETACTSAGAIVITVNKQAVLCPTDGSAGDADTSGLKGFTGKITCPAAAKMCNNELYAAVVKVPTGTTGGGTTGAPTTSTAAPESAEQTAAKGASKLSPTYADLPAECSAREECANAVLQRLPSCQRSATELIECFGQNCDTLFDAWLKSNGVKANCTGDAAKASYAGYCMEGRAGVFDMCALVSGATGLASTALATLAGVVLIAFCV